MLGIRPGKWNFRNSLAWKFIMWCQTKLKNSKIET